VSKEGARISLSASQWEAPWVLARFATLAREAVYHVEKYLEIGERAKTQDLQDLLAEISSKTNQRWDLEQLVELYQREERQSSKACA
jgi:hypothetical protein